MTFKTDVDGGYKAGFLCFLLFTAIFVYFTVTSFSVTLLILAIIFSLMFFVLLIPMYFSMKYIVEEDGLRIKVGWFANRFFPYSSIFGFQRVLAEAKNSYGLSTRKRIAIYMKGTGGGYDVCLLYTSPGRNGSHPAGCTYTLHWRRERRYQSPCDRKQTP